MYARCIAAAVVVASAACLFFLPPPVAPAQPQSVVEQIDFDALHMQAQGALEALQQSHGHRLASAASTAF
jgi:hypothetical protein